MIIATDKVESDRKRGKRTNQVILANFCPMCGESYGDVK